MTLKGANKALKRGSTNEIVRDTELLERLQRIRAALVEVREELKLGVGEQIVDSEIEEPKAEVAEVAAEVAAEAEAEPAVEPTVEPASEPAAEPAAEVQAEQPKKRTVRRKKKGDDDNKELFPFYEQSLF